MTSLWATLPALWRILYMFSSFEAEGKEVLCRRLVTKKQITMTRELMKQALLKELDVNRWMNNSCLITSLWVIQSVFIILVGVDGRDSM